jgi:chemotaxis protein MotB
MAAVENSQLVFIKRVKKRPHSDGHHGGAWKVAYADFVTAMMAFFLLLWLLNATTEEEKNGIADYFAPASVSKTKSGAGGIMGGKTMSEDGAKASTTSSPNVTIAIPVPGRSDEESEEQVDSEMSSASSATGANSDQVAESAQLAIGEGENLSILEGTVGTGKDEDRGETAETQTAVAYDHTGAVAEADEFNAEMLARLEQEEFARVEEQLREALRQTPELAEFAENLLIDQTPEGLRIQLIDQEAREMFPLGSYSMYDHTRQLMAQISQVIAQMPNKISVSGHTDATAYRTDTGYGNWELSTDRANASRRALIEAGLDTSRIINVVGKAETDPMFPEDPKAAGNRRISIVLLHEDFSSRPNMGAMPRTSTDADSAVADEEAPPTDGANAADEPAADAATSETAGSESAGSESAPEASAEPAYYSPTDTVESALPYGG